MYYNFSLITCKNPLLYCLKQKCYAITTNVTRNFASQKIRDVFKPRIVESDSLPNYEGARSGAYYLSGLIIFMLGAGFAAVPLYERFCKATNYGGILSDSINSYTRGLKRVPERELIIQFNADKNAMLQWNFKPMQGDIKVVPGETVLAFYTAENPTDKIISGISTYNVVPFEAAQYFNKIQCFCFDEQQLNPHEQVDMPVFFYIDPELVEDPDLLGIDTITLSYTFFEAKEGLNLPFMPKY